VASSDSGRYHDAFHCNIVPLLPNLNPWFESMESDGPYYRHYFWRLSKTSYNESIVPFGVSFSLWFILESKLGFVGFS